MGDINFGGRGFENRKMGGAAPPPPPPPRVSTIGTWGGPPPPPQLWETLLVVSLFYFALLFLLVYITSCWGCYVRFWKKISKGKWNYFSKFVKENVKLFSWKEFIHKKKVIQSFWCRYWFQITLWKLEALNMKRKLKVKSVLTICFPNHSRRAIYGPVLAEAAAWMC